MHYIPRIDAGISGSSDNNSYMPYVEGLSQSIFIKNYSNKNPFRGKAWNLESTVWPDFTHTQAPSYYSKMLQNLHENIPFDGVWLVSLFFNLVFRGGAERDFPTAYGSL